MRLTFIGGSGRSGTSITRKLLGSSENITTLAFEHRILIDPDGPIEFLESLSSFSDPYKTDLAINRMFDHLNSLDASSVSRSFLDRLIKSNAFLKSRVNLSQYSGWKLSDTFPNYSHAVSKFRSRIKLITFKGRWAGSPGYKINNRMHYFTNSEKDLFVSALNEFYCSLIGNLLQQTGCNHFVEDSTWNILYINTLSQVFPEAKFIHVFRDPRDVVASFTKQRWMPNDFKLAAKIYKDLMNAILKAIGSNKNCFNLRFEDLIKNQDAEVGRLCTFLDIDYSQGMKSFQLNSGNIGRYLKDFDGEEIFYLNSKLAPELETLGYAR